MLGWCFVSYTCAESAVLVLLAYLRCSLFDADVDPLPDQDDSVGRNGLSMFHENEVLEYGEWKYFKFEVGNYSPLYSCNKLASSDRDRFCGIIKFF